MAILAAFKKSTKAGKKNTHKVDFFYGCLFFVFYAFYRLVVLLVVVVVVVGLLELETFYVSSSSTTTHLHNFE